MLSLLARALLSLPTLAQSYTATILTSDIAKISDNTGANLANPWGLVANSWGPWWVSDNGTGLSTLYNGSGTPLPLVVTIPSWDGNGTGVPSGIAFNSTSDFQLTPGNPATFLFVTEDGSVQGWNHNVNPTSAVIEANNFAAAVCKGMALASAGGANYIYATNLIVTYAKQDAAKHDDVAGPGTGHVDIYDAEGNLWALELGNGGSAGRPTNTLFFTAGTFDETYGSFGSILPNPGQGTAVGQQSNKPTKSHKSFLCNSSERGASALLFGL